MTKFKIDWIDRGRPPREKPNPAYPNGIDLDTSNGAAKTCTVQLPYPAPHKNIGTWFVTCETCGYRAACTMASRPDDPRSIKLPCKAVNNGE